MPVIREDRQFRIGPIGVTRASGGGTIVGQAISNSADQLAEMFYKEAAREAEKTGLEIGASQDRPSVITIDPKTGEPEAYDVPQGFGTIGAEAYQRVVLRRFQQGIEEEIQNKGKLLAVKFEDSPNAVNLYTAAMSDYLASMTNVAEGQFKGYIEDVGTSYLNATRASMAVAQIRRERAAAKAAQANAVAASHNALEYSIAQNGVGSLADPSSTSSAISQSAEVTKTDGQEAQLFTPTDVSGMSLNERLSITRGQLRFVVSREKDPEVLAQLQAAIGTQNANLIPEQFPELRALVGQFGDDYKSLASLEKFTDSLVPDQLVYTNIQRNRDIAQQKIENDLMVAAISDDVVAQGMVARSNASNPNYESHVTKYQAAVEYEDSTGMIVQAIEQGNPDLAKALTQRRDDLLTATRDGYYARMTRGLTPQQTEVLEAAIDNESMMQAPASSRDAFFALQSLGQKTGVDLFDGAKAYIGSYRDGAGQAVKDAQEADALFSLSQINFGAISTVDDPVAARMEAMSAASNIEGISPDLLGKTQKSADESVAKNYQSKFFGTRPSIIAMERAAGYISTGDVASLEGLTKAQQEYAINAREYGMQSGKEAELRTHFNENEGLREKVIAREVKAAEKADRMVRIAQGIADPTSKEDQKLAEEMVQMNLPSGATVADLVLAQPDMNNYDYVVGMNAILRSPVLPETLVNVFKSMAVGNTRGMDSSVTLSHFMSLRNIIVDGETRQNPSLDALTASELAVLNFMADAAPNFSNMTSKDVSSIFNDYVTAVDNELGQKKMVKFFGDKTAQDIVAEIVDDPNLLSLNETKEVEAAVVMLYNLSRSQNLSSSDVIDLIRKQIEDKYLKTSNDVRGIGGSMMTRFDLSRTVGPSNIDDFKAVVTLRAEAADPTLGRIGFGVDKPFLGGLRSVRSAAQSRIYLEPISSSGGVTRYAVKVRRPLEDGGDYVLERKMTDDEGTYSVPLLVSTSDAIFLKRLKQRDDKKISDAEAAEEVRRSRTNSEYVQP